METLVIDIKSKKDSKLVKELLIRLDISIRRDKSGGKKEVSKSKLTPEDLKSMGGILKGQLISKEHLRSLAWKKRNW